MSAWVPPLGRPGRFGMTPGQQAFYRRIVARAVQSGSAMVPIKATADALGMSSGTVHHMVHELILRGFIEPWGPHAYALSDPVMDFKAIPAERRAA